MVLNDFKSDIYALCRAEKKLKNEVASEIGISKSSLSQTMNRQIIVSSYVRVCEALGYDIRVEYVKR